MSVRGCATRNSVLPAQISKAGDWASSQTCQYLASIPAWQLCLYLLLRPSSGMQQEMMSLRLGSTITKCSVALKSR